MAGLHRRVRSASGPSARRSIVMFNDFSVETPGNGRMTDGDVVFPHGAWSFEAHTASIGHARDAAAAWLAEHGAAELAEDVRLLVSELATNAVVHAGTAFRLATLLDDHVARIEVTDHDHRAPTVQSPGPQDLGGRGLVIVQAVAARWGVHAQRDSGGKTVWFEVDRLVAAP